MQRLPVPNSAPEFLEYQTNTNDANGKRGHGQSTHRAEGVDAIVDYLLSIKDANQAGGRRVAPS
jgi:hypothetical protein